MADKRQFEPDESMRALAEKVAGAYRQYLPHIDTDRILFYRESLGCMSRADAKCRMITEPYKSILQSKGLDADWIIEFYSVHTAHKSENYLAVLMLHELMHIGGNGKLVDHDIQDFRDILRGVGAEWAADRDIPDILTDKIALDSRILVDGQ